MRSLIIGSARSDACRRCEFPLRRRRSLARGSPARRIHPGKERRQGRHGIHPRTDKKGRKPDARIQADDYRRAGGGKQYGSKLADIASSEFDKQLKALTSIRGIGITLATALILTTGGFTFFDNAKQLSRFIGICPTYQQSGTSVNIKGHINRNGDEHLRSLLYVASWTALRYNAACRECYIRLKANGKPSKVALIAVANKPLRIKFYFFQ